MDERRRDRAEDGEQRALEPAAEPGHLDEHDREQHGRGLDEHVAAAHVRELVREHALELGRAQRPEQPGGDRERRALRAAAGGERARKAVGIR